MFTKKSILAISAGCAVLGMSMLLGSCTKIQHSTPYPLSPQARIGVVAFNNYTDSVHANESATVITTNLLHAHGFAPAANYQGEQNCNNQSNKCTSRFTDKPVRQWAKTKSLDFVLTGEVNEWHYKVGLDGEPAVSVTMTLWDVNSGEPVWRSVGSKIGSAHGAIGTTAQTMINDQLNSLTPAS